MEGSGESAFRRPGCTCCAFWLPSMRLGRKALPSHHSHILQVPREQRHVCPRVEGAHGFAFDPLWKILQVGDWVMLPEASKHYRNNALGVSSLSLVESTNLLGYQLCDSLENSSLKASWTPPERTFQRGSVIAREQVNSQMPTGLRGIISSYWEAQILYIKDAAITWGTSGNSSQHPMGERINSRNLLW